ncbi:MAG: hypothetical protein K6L73_00215 [Cellvibrionaceae bacterium]
MLARLFAKGFSNKGFSLPPFLKPELVADLLSNSLVFWLRYRILLQSLTLSVLFSLWVLATPALASALSGNESSYSVVPSVSAFEQSQVALQQLQGQFLSNHMGLKR